MSDLRFAVRSFAKNYGFTAAVVATLALGISAATTVFTVVDAALLRPVPLPEPQRLVKVYSTSRGSAHNSITYLNYLDWAEQSRSILQLAAFRAERFTLTERGLPEPLVGARASANLLAVLGVEPLRGRMFRPEEDRRHEAGVVLLGERFWRTRFAADESIVGQALTLNGRSHTIIGVVPERARLRVDSRFLDDVLVPLGQVEDEVFWRRGVADGTVGVGRLAPGLSIEQARAHMNRVAANLAAAHPADNEGVGIFVDELADDLLAGREPMLMAPFAAVGLVLLIACTNVANLLIARGVGRRHELAIRTALGASRGRLVRQQLVDSTVLGLFGGVAGAAIAAGMVPALIQFLPAAAPSLSAPTVNLRALGFALAAAIGSGMLAGLLPARSIGTSLELSGRGIVARRSRVQRSLIATEVALTLVLLVSTGLLIRSMVRLLDVHPGFDATNVSIFLTGISPERSSSPERIRASMRELGDAIAAVPGIEHVSVEVGVLPLGRGSSGLGYWLASEARPGLDQLRRTLFYGIGPEYLDVMRIPLIRGRNITRADDSRQSRVALIDEELARQAFGGRDPIGQQLRFGFLDEPVEIVGVVGHVLHWGLDDDADNAIRSQLYLPYAQLPDAITSLVPRNVQVVLRSPLALGTLLPELRRAVAAFDGGQAVSDERTMSGELAATVAPRRLAMIVLAALAVSALVLSCVGIYGVVSYLTAQRRAEMGVRMAVGARPQDVLWMILKDGQRVAAIGIGAGLVAVFVLTPYLSSLLFEVTPTDPATLGAAAMLVATVTLVACYAPARRASRVDPVTALRAD